MGVTKKKSVYEKLQDKRRPWVEKELPYAEHAVKSGSSRELAAWLNAAFYTGYLAGRRDALRERRVAR